MKAKIIDFNNGYVTMETSYGIIHGYWMESISPKVDKWYRIELDTNEIISYKDINYEKQPIGIYETSKNIRVTGSRCTADDEDLIVIDYGAGLLMVEIDDVSKVSKGDIITVFLTHINVYSVE